MMMLDLVAELLRFRQYDSIQDRDGVRMSRSMDNNMFAGKLHLTLRVPVSFEPRGVRR